MKKNILLFCSAALAFAMVLLSAFGAFGEKAAEDENPVSDYETSSSLNAEEFAEFAGSETTGMFDNILGCSGYYVDETGFDGWATRTYYAKGTDGSNIVIAKSYGFENDDYVLDIDGDGKTELVCNCVAGGDCHKEVYIFDKDTDGIKIGYVNWLKLGIDDIDYWGCNAVCTYYDASANKIVIKYCSSQTEEMCETACIKSSVIDYEAWDGETFPFINQEEAYALYLKIYPSVS